MAKAPAPYTAQQYLLDDHPRTLFPMTTTLVVASKALPQIQEHLTEIFDPASSAAFLVQQRCYAAKTGHHLRRTAALDPVAAFFIYDLVFSHRARLNVKSTATRRSFGYRFQLGKPIAPSVSYGAFRSEIRKAVPKYKHALTFDISAYFNSVYHHDLAEWFEASIAAGPHEQFGQFLRECNRGRSIDCLPHGFHPCKAIGSAFLHDIDSAVQLQSALLLRFLDDFYLFDDDEHVLIGDFMRIQQLLVERFQLTPWLAGELLARAERTATESVAWQGFTHAIKQELAPEERIEVIEMLWEVAYADGHLHDYEASLLRRVAGLLYVGDRESGEARLRVMAKRGIKA